MLLQRIRDASPILAFALALPIVMGQNQPQEWTIITATQIKPGFRAEFEGVQKEITAAYKKAGVNRLVAQTIFGDLEEYVSIVQVSRFGELDGPSVLEKALGAAGAQQLLRKGGGYLMSAHRISALSLNDVSIQTAGDPGEYVLVMNWRLARGKGSDFTAFMKNDYLPAMRKAGIQNLWVSQVVFGGSPSERVVVRPMHKLAEIDGGPPARKALGVEGAQLLGLKIAGIVESTQYSISRLRMDLSNMAPPAGGSQ